MHKKMFDQCVNAHLVIEERIVMKRMVCDTIHRARSVSHEVNKTKCMLNCVFFHLHCFQTTHNIN
jgi:hypothetical protein